MDLTLSAEQEMLVDATRRFLARAWSLADTRATERDPRGFRPDVWRAMAGLGWQGMELPAADGSGRLTGRRPFVPFAPDADLLLVATAGPSLVALERGAAGVAVTRLATLGGDPVYGVVLDGARGEPLGAPGAAGAALVRT